MKLIFRRVLILQALFFHFYFCLAQPGDQFSYIKGRVVDELDSSYKDAHVQALNSKFHVATEADGYFILQLASDRSYTLRVTHISANPVELLLDYQVPGDTTELIIVLKRGRIIKTIDVFEGRKSKIDIEVDPDEVKNLPNPTGDISGILKTFAGVNSNNELSTQYSVRGGNYDENLVYINGIEIYRPFLTRSGQQEGLSIINTQMVKKLSFSAGGFNAYYGDKLSSVLDITYRDPDSFKVECTASFLGAAASIEGDSKNHIFSYLVAGRYRSNQYLLNSLDVKGDYKPIFSDLQSMLTYKSLYSTLSLLTYYGSNRYRSVPQSQKTKFGTINQDQALQLDVYYDGQEITFYNTGLSALKYDYRPHDSLTLTFSASAYFANEQERFDVLAQYYLSALETDVNSEDYGNPKYTLGVGSYLNHARNRLFASIFSIQHRGQILKKNQVIDWGGVVQMENFNDKLEEWRYLDSAGYSVPRGREETIDLYMTHFTQINLQNQRTSAYLQDAISLNKDLNAQLTIGGRVSYLNYNNQLLFAPRINYSFEPNRRFNKDILINNRSKDSLKKNLKFKAAAGLYQQPPLYRELRTKEGVLVPKVKAQQSAHLLTGLEWNFELWNRKTPFKFNTEFYGKYLWDLIPYEIENVRIRYLPEQTAIGYIVGADFQVSGEFIPDLPSWFSFSLLSARENIKGDFYTDKDGRQVEKGWMPRPTDQRYAANILFQDFLKKNETYRIYLNLSFAHGLPFGPPNNVQYRNELRIPPYRRVDIGFSKVLYERGKSKSPSKFVKLTDNISLSAQIFNLFGIRNTISYLWVTDVNNEQYAVPSFLTSRRLNLQINVVI